MAGRGVGSPPYPAALRLYSIAAEHWAVIDASYPAVDLIRFRPHRFLNFIYAWCLTRIPPEEVEEWIRVLNEPLPGKPRKKPTQTEIEDEGAGFMTALATFGSDGG